MHQITSEMTLNTERLKSTLYTKYPGSQFWSVYNRRFQDIAHFITPTYYQVKREKGTKINT